MPAAARVSRCRNGAIASSPYGLSGAGQGLMPPSGTFVRRGRTRAGDAAPTVGLPDARRWCDAGRGGPAQAERTPNRDGGGAVRRKARGP